MRARSIACSDRPRARGLDAGGARPQKLGVRTLLALLVLTGCGTAAASPDEPLEYVERGGNGELPLIVALHGRGDRPERFSEVFDDLDAPARVMLVRAPLDEGRGRGWFSFRFGFDAAMDDMGALLPRLQRTIADYVARHPTRGRPILVGFSQGAMIVYAYAAQHPGEVSLAVPISGGLPTRFEPRTAEGLPPFRAIHGSTDEVIEPRWSRESVARLRELGADATYTEVPAAPHWMTAPMREALFEAIEPSLR